MTKHTRATPANVPRSRSRWTRRQRRERFDPIKFLRMIEDTCRWVFDRHATCYLTGVPFSDSERVTATENEIRQEYVANAVREMTKGNC